MDTTVNAKELTTLPLRNGYIEQWLKNNPAVSEFSLEQHGDETIVKIKLGQDSAQSVEKSLIHWEGVFDGTYEKMDENLFHGWQSTFTGDPIPLPDMEEWQTQTIENILRSKSPKILELGSGSGLIVSQILPHATCTKFLATDLSAQAVGRLKERFGQNSKIEIKQGDAVSILKEFQALDPKPEFDLVILNSVVQYFPNVKYLEDVMTRSLDFIAPGGRLFIGDIRNLDSLDLHLLSLEIQNSAATAAVDSKKILEKMEDRRKQTFELLLSPEYFKDFAGSRQDISHVLLETHRGKYLNEMQRYRFNVSLVKKGHPGIASVDTETFEFGNLTLESLSEILKSKKYEQLYVRDIPTKRLSGEATMLKELKSTEKLVHIGQLKLKGKKCEEEAQCLGEVENVGRSEGYRVIFIPKWYNGSCSKVDGLFYIPIPSNGNELLKNYVPITSTDGLELTREIQPELYNDPSGNKEKLVASSILSIQLKRSLRGCPLPMPTVKFI